MNTYSDPSHGVDDEISLLDIYMFIKEGWKSIAISTFFAGILGVGAAFVLPEKYLASASIQPAKVLGNDVETVAMLAEKMKSPTYYSSNTFSLCNLNETPNAGQELTKALNPNVAKNSSFVSISFKAISPQQSRSCLDAVLGDVVRNQNEIAENRINLAKSNLSKDKEKLLLAERFLSSLSKQSKLFDFKDEQFSASQLLLATIQSKQSEVTELKNSIQQAELLLMEPQTKTASFTTPIFSPESKVEPKRSLIIAISVLAGGLLGLLWLFVRRAMTKIKEQSVIVSKTTLGA